MAMEDQYELYCVYLSARDGDVYAKVATKAEGPEQAEAIVLAMVDRGEVDWRWLDSGEHAESAGRDVEVTGVQLWEVIPK
jgi:hypothetical protein